MERYLSADGFPVHLGGWFWDSNLDIVQVTTVADFAERNENTGVVAYWHRTDVPAKGRRGEMSDGSRLARTNPFNGKVAETEAREQGLIWKSKVRPGYVIVHWYLDIDSDHFPEVYDHWTVARDDIERLRADDKEPGWQVIKLWEQYDALRLTKDGVATDDLLVMKRLNGEN